MKEVKLFSSNSGIFSKRELEKKKLAQKKKFKKIQKELKKKYHEKENKRKILNKIRAKDQKSLIKLKKKQAKELENKRKKKSLKLKIKSQKIKTKKNKQKPTLTQKEKDQLTKKNSTEIQDKQTLSKKIKIIKKSLSPKPIITKHIPSSKKESKNRLIEKSPNQTIPIKKPSIPELESLLLRFSENYDKGIIKSRTLYKSLEDLGLSHSGLQEIKNEKESKRKKRIQKINQIHEELMKELEQNKYTEKEIENLHKLIQKERELL
ncbi:MAG: hypothetical protein PF542_03135 [Nanoarchaeota archaeon]|jgi:hypothetical protein|nr:hypothetical protein [Nanoarchaeota archaeon]